jgi:hypothetical protein
MQLHVSEEGAGQNRSGRAAGLTHGRALAAPIMEMGLTRVEKKAVSREQPNITLLQASKMDTEVLDG